MNVSEKILEIIKLQGLTKKKVYDTLNITQQGFDDKLRKSYFNTHELEKMSILFNVPLDYFFNNKYVLDSKGNIVRSNVTMIENAKFIEVYKVTIPAYAGYISKGSDRIQVKELQKTLIYDADNYDPENTIVFEIEGNSMLPQIDYNDEVVCVRIEEKQDLKKNKIYVFVTNTDILIKRLGGVGSKKLLLLSDNTDYKPLEIDANEIKEVWRVVQIMRKVE